MPGCRIKYCNFLLLFPGWQTEQPESVRTFFLMSLMKMPKKNVLLPGLFFLITPAVNFRQGKMFAVTARLFAHDPLNEVDQSSGTGQKAQQKESEAAFTHAAKEQVIELMALDQIPMAEKIRANAQAVRAAAAETVRMTLCDKKFMISLEQIDFPATAFPVAPVEEFPVHCIFEFWQCDPQFHDVAKEADIIIAAGNPFQKFREFSQTCGVFAQMAVGNQDQHEI